jgi:hypothetical protein
LSKNARFREHWGKDVTDREQLQQAILALQGQRAALGDAVVDASIAALRK